MTPEQMETYFRAFEPWGAVDKFILIMIVAGVITGLLMEYSLNPKENE